MLSPVVADRAWASRTERVGYLLRRREYAAAKRENASFCGDFEVVVRSAAMR